MSSEDAKLSESPKSRKPTTRSSSLRQTLTSASKAIIAGVRSKDSADDKAARKAKASTRRQSAIVAAAPSAPRQSIGSETRPVISATKRENTPDNKVVTRRRAAAQAKARPDEETMQKSPDNITSISALRATGRTRAANAPSGLPKPRAKTTAAENIPAAKPSTPVRTGTRRRLSTSSDEGAKEQQKPGGDEDGTPKEKQDKNSRPISPLPHRAALKNSTVLNATPPTTPSTTSSKAKPSGNKSSPTRPAKLLKTTNASAASSITRPSSAASVASSITPRTPKSSTLKAALTRSAKDLQTATSSTPLRSSPITPSRDSPSPLARRSQANHKPAGSMTPSSHTGNMSHISEGNSEDSEEDDVVELLLAPVTSPNLAASTPSVPRIMSRDRRNEPLLQTPSKDKSPATKSDRSRLAPPQSNGLLRPRVSLRVPKETMNGTASSRKSILTWEQISSDASRTLGEGEAERMIADIPAPFSGPTSPALSALMDVPPSPCLSAIDSPGGFGSISQVLLPDVTPSPAVFSSARWNVSPEASAESSSTYLRLQLASAEHLAHERLLRIQAMEEEIHDLKAAHTHQMEEIANQMAHMEQEDRRAGYAIQSLEEQLWQLRMNGEKAVEAAREEVEAVARTQKHSALKAQQCHMEVLCAATVAEGSWTSVLDTCNAELESIQGERQMLALLLSELQALATY